MPPLPPERARRPRLLPPRQLPPPGPPTSPPPKGHRVLKSPPPSGMEFRTSSPSFNASGSPTDSSGPFTQSQPPPPPDRWTPPASLAWGLILKFTGPRSVAPEHPPSLSLDQWVPTRTLEFIILPVSQRLASPIPSPAPASISRWSTHRPPFHQCAPTCLASRDVISRAKEEDWSRRGPQKFPPRGGGGWTPLPPSSSLLRRRTPSSHSWSPKSGSPVSTTPGQGGGALSRSLSMCGTLCLQPRPFFLSSPHESDTSLNSSETNFLLYL